MPELPEVETVRAYLERVLGWRLAQITLRRTDLRYPVDKAAIEGLRGAVITGARRRAKYLLLDTVADDREARTLLIHLGMSGRLFLDLEPDPPFEKHEHARFLLRDGDGAAQLRFVDPRRFGALEVMATAAQAHHRLLAKLGPEPLLPSFDGTALHAACQGRSVAIKQRIMDASAVVGVGNIYASEACWRARISPRREAGRLSRRAADRLASAIKDVLQEAVAAGGTTLRDFVGGDAAPGYFQQRLDVYGRDGRPCPRCPDSVVKKAVQQGRMTYWCPGCQR